MALKLSVSWPISSLEVISSFREKSPWATCSMPSVSRWRGSTIVLDSRKESRTEMMRPRASASMMRENISALRLRAVSRLSRI